MNIFWALLDSRLFVSAAMLLLATMLAVTTFRLFIATIRQRKTEIVANDRETQAIESNKILRQTLGSLHAQVWYLDTAARVIDFNLYTEEFLHKSPVQARGFLMSTLLPHWNDADQSQARNLQAIKSGKREIGVVESYQADGETHWVRVDRVPSMADNGEIDGLMLFIYDITPLKSTEQALRFQKTLLEAQSESSLDGIWVVSPDGRWLTSNQRFLEIWRFPRALAQASNSNVALEYLYAQLVQPAPFRQQVQRLSADTETKTADVLHLRDGRHIDWFTAPITGDDGHQYGRAWYFRDVTETRQTEKALRASEAENRALINSIPDMLFRVHQDGTFLDYYGTASNASLMEAGNFVGRHATEVFEAAVAEQFMAKLATALADNCIQINEYKLSNLNGKSRYWEQRIVASSKHEALLIIRDITNRKETESAIQEAHEKLEQRVLERTTELRMINEQLQLEVEERRRAEEARRESEERLELALHGADLGLIDIDLQKRQRACEQKQIEIPGHQLNHFYDTVQSWVSFIHPDDRKRVLHALHAHLDERSTFFEQEYRLQADPDTWYWVRCRGRVVSRDAHNQPLRFSGTQMDITEYKALEQQLLQSQKMEAVGRLAGGVAHDFNNILTVIISYSELALRQLPAGQPERLRLRLKEIRKAAEKATRLTRQLLLFSRSETVAPVALDVNRSVVDIEEMLERLIGEHLHLDIRLDPAAGSIKADPGQIEQILLNLVVNARDAMPEGGTIEVATEHVHFAPHESRPHPDMEPGRYVLLSVTDNGCGMDSATQERIFEPFFTTKGAGKGTGLGLAIVFGAVKQNYGYISVESELNRGTTFAICFPSFLPAMQLPPQEKDQREDASGVETILLVEDEDSIRSLASATLQEAGYTVLPAANGEEALTLTAKHRGPIDLVVTDVIMPGMSGVKLSHKMAALRPATKILYISGYTDGELNMSTRLSRDHAFLPKPFTPDTLATKVRALLDT